MALIFISHSSRNNDKATEVRDWLAANGWTDVFLDLDPERGIVVGQRWKDALQKAAYRCEAVLALVSAEWLASSWCKSEIDAARLMGKKVIVALVGIDKAQVPVDLTDEQFIDLSADPQAYRRLKEGLKRAGLDPTSFPFVAGRRPYPGFAYLEEQDAAVFFGRDAQIVRGLDELRRLVSTGVSRILVILGASGSGKSSFLRAGLWPRLQRDDRAWLPLPIIRPERAVISGTFGLAGALQQIISQRARIDPQRVGQNLDETPGFVPAFLVEQFLALIESKNDRRLRRIFAGHSRYLPDVAQGVEERDEPVFRIDEVLDVGAAARQAALAKPAGKSRLAILAMRSDSFPLVQADPSLAALPKDTFTLDMMLEAPTAR